MTTPSWNPGTLLQLSGSYWQTCTLHAGVKLGLFTVIGTGSMQAEEIASKLDTDIRGMTLLLNALSAMGLLEKEGQIYRNTSSAKQFLDRDSKGYIGHMIMHHHHLVESWARMDESVISGKPVSPSIDIDEDQRREAFLMGMYTIASQQAPEITENIDLGQRRRLLDLGGGPGTYAISFCKKNQNLEAVIYDLPTTKPFAQKTVAQHRLSDRITFTPGNYVTENMEGMFGQFDVVWLSHILHAEGPETNAQIVEKAVRMLQPGGMIIVHDFILSDTMDSPVFPALFALNMLQATDDGQSYSESQIRQWLNAAGVSRIERSAYVGPTESGIMVGIVPSP